jgi:NADPH:quinone reductase-like Zn-dependent oxidoreductase
LIQAIDVNRIRPVIDRVLSFDQAAEAFALQAHGSYFGKIAIKF